MTAVDHRLTLRRGPPEEPCLCWVMLNPSTADDHEDDPTIRKVRGFTVRAGFEAFRVVNLFTARATKPRALWALTSSDRNHPEADHLLMGVCRGAAGIVMAWGAHAERCPERVEAVQAIIRAAGAPVYRLGGLTKGGHPRHPLMTPYSAGLVRVQP